MNIEAFSFCSDQLMWTRMSQYISPDNVTRMGDSFISEACSDYAGLTFHHIRAPCFSCGTLQ